MAVVLAGDVCARASLRSVRSEKEMVAAVDIQHATCVLADLMPCPIHNPLVVDNIDRY